METIQFKEWLTEKNYSTRTIKDYTTIVMNAPKIERYEDLITHIRNLQGKVKPETINQRLVSLRLYFEYLKEEELISVNIAHKVKVKTQSSFITLLKAEELEKLYEDYPSRTEVELRRKVLLGLLIYQGADLGTVKHLKVEHLALEKSEIYLPSTRRMNSRKLSLNGNQILPLYRYLEQKPVSLFKNEKHLINQYEGYSVITNWLSQYNLREVQYYAGHKHIGSTEKYKRVDLESMKSDLKKYHPLG